MQLKLIYFDQPFWRAEIVRLCLFISDIEFEDYRITSEDLNDIKENGELSDGTIIPFMQLPVLVIEGQSIAQNWSYCKNLWKDNGYVPQRYD